MRAHGRGFIGIASLVFVIAACASEAAPPPDTTVLDQEVGNSDLGSAIGPEGGSVTSGDAMAEIVIPEGAVTEPTDIAITAVTSDDPAVVAEFEMTPGGLEFDTPVTIVMTIPDNFSGELSDLEFVHVWDGGEDLVESALDELERTISGEISHFSRAVLRLPPIDVRPTETYLTGTATRRPIDQGPVATSTVVATVSYLPKSKEWIVALAVENDFSAPLDFELFAEGGLTLPAAYPITSGDIPVGGRCLVEIQGQLAQAAFEGVPVPFEVLHEEETPSSGDWVALILHPDGGELYARDTPDFSDCPILGDTVVIDIVLTEAEELPLVPLGPKDS